MEIEKNFDFTLTDTPDSADERHIIKNLWRHNAKFDPVHLHPLLVTLKDETGEIIGGLVGRTWWGGLDIQYLWVQDNYRKNGVGKRLMLMAEEEAVKRGCHMAYVDTFNFQAIEFYQKLGYKEYGKLPAFLHKHTRHYLTKQLDTNYEY